MVARRHVITFMLVHPVIMEVLLATKVVATTVAKDILVI
jgi:hypothetical protein